MIKNLVIVVVIAAAGFGLYTVMQDKAAPQPAAVSDALPMQNSDTPPVMQTRNPCAFIASTCAGH